MAKKKAKRKFLLFIIVCALLVFAALIIISGQNTSNKTAKIYFFKNTGPVIASRDIPDKANTLYSITGELLRGPTKEEKKSGIFTRIPAKTKINDIYIKDGTVIADFTKELNVPGGGTDRVKDMLYQIVYTYTGMPGIKNIQIMINGKMQIALGSEGFVIEKPLSRDDVSAK